MLDKGTVMPQVSEEPVSSWSFDSENDRMSFTLDGHEPVYFDGTKPQVRRWMKRKHLNGSMHEPVFANVLMCLIKRIDPKVYFDIGGFIGYFTILPLTVLAKHARVYAFEMNRDSCRLLRSNVALNTHLAPSRVFIVNAGISDRTEFAKKVWVEGFKLVGESPDIISNDEIDVLSLDYILESMDLLPDLIKMDIEGFEAAALRGASNLLRTKRPTILFELHSLARLEVHGETRVSVLSGFKDAGYTVLAVNGGRRSAQIVERPLVAPGSEAYEAFVESGNSSFVAIPTERLHILADMVA